MHDPPPPRCAEQKAVPCLITRWCLACMLSAPGEFSAMLALQERFTFHLWQSCLRAQQTVMTHDSLRAGSHRRMAAGAAGLRGAHGRCPPYHLCAGRVRQSAPPQPATPSDEQQLVMVRGGIAQLSLHSAGRQAEAQ